MITFAIACVNTIRYGNAMDEKKNRKNWLNAGLTALADAGPKGLRIMSIAKQLGVTKGSFYWHFKNLEEYESALIEEWEQCHTLEAIECVENAGGDADTKLRHWFMGAAASDFTLARAIRSWSLTDQVVREVQARVDQRRIDYLVKLLRGIGWPKEEATTLGRWAYWAFIGYSTLEGPPVTIKQLTLILDILTPR